MSVVTHDLRNPIAVIRASAQMAGRQITRGDPEAAQRRLQAIVDQTSRLGAMLEVFLDAAQVEAQRMPLRAEPVDLADVVRGSLGRLEAILPESARRPADLDLADGCIGLWDRARVSRVVSALMENASLYGAPGAPLRVRLQRDGRSARLTVSAGGPGPTPDEQPRLFEQFFRGHAAAEAGHSGSGLGLFTSRGIARAHGGEVRQAPDGPADAFELELPLAEDPATTG